MNKFKLLAGPMRVPFLLLNPSCVIAGAAAGIWRTGIVSYRDCALALVGAVLSHISVNSLNEYHDFRTGLDSRTSRTPFSGGSGTLQAHPELWPWALGLGLGSALLVAIIGIYFIAVRGPLILVPGVAGLAIILAYTPVFTKNPWTCLAAPGLGFGTCMVLGSEYAVAGSFSSAGFIASLVPFFLVSNLLLLNQFPDVAADRSAGRSHLIIRHGSRVAALVYVAFLVGCYASIGAGVLLKITPPATLLGLLTIPLAVKAGQGALLYREDIPKLIPFMGMNVVINLVTPVLVGAGFLLAR